MQDDLLKNPITDLKSVLELIPQKPPFVMVDALLSYTPLTGLTRFTIPKENILIENGFFSEAGITEHMAQSMSLHRGYQGFLEGLKKPRTGFIGVIKSVEIFELPTVGDRLETYVEILHEIMNVTLVKAETKNKKGKLIAISEMKTVTVD